jgi:hypothetical protein
VCRWCVVGVSGVCRGRGSALAAAAVAAAAAALIDTWQGFRDCDCLEAHISHSSSERGKNKKKGKVSRVGRRGEVEVSDKSRARGQTQPWQETRERMNRGGSVKRGLCGGCEGVELHREDG